MSEKSVSKFNFSLPGALAMEFRSIGDIHGERNKLRYAVAGAAILKLIEMPKDERDALVQKVYGARHFPGAIEKLVEDAKKVAESKGINAIGRSLPQFPLSATAPPKPATRPARSTPSDQLRKKRDQSK